MPPRLPILPAFTAPRAFMARISRPFSSTPAVAQESSDPTAPSPLEKLVAENAASSPASNTASNLLDLGAKPQVHSSDRIRGLINRNGRSRSEGALARHREMLQTLRDKKKSDDYLKQMPRRWRVGDLYAPHDLSPVEMKKWRTQRMPQVDVFDMLAINPLDHYKNFSMISEFMSSFGQIRNSRDTGLRPVNQRRVAKAIRRAIGMGIHPSVHFHPELLKKKFRMFDNRS